MMGFWDDVKAAWEDSQPTREVKVVTYKGEKAAQRGIERMLKQGWQIEGQDSRRQVFSMHKGGTVLLPVAGLFTGKQKITITFVKEREK
jgi:hypothetical protein